MSIHWLPRKSLPALPSRHAAYTIRSAMSCQIACCCHIHHMYLVRQPATTLFHSQDDIILALASPGETDRARRKTSPPKTLTKPLLLAPHPKLLV